MQQALVTQLIKLTRKCTNAAAFSFLEGTSNLKPVQLVTRGKAAWDDAILCTRDMHMQAPRDNNGTTSSQPCRHAAEGNTCDECPNIHIMICPLCTKESVAVGHKFVTSNLAIRVTCQHSGKKPLTVRWKCSCGIPWHGCPRHAEHSNALTTAQVKPRRENKQESKRKHNATMYDLLDEDLMHESKKARLYTGAYAAPDSCAKGQKKRSLIARFPTLCVGVSLVPSTTRWVINRVLMDTDLTDFKE